MTKNIANYLFIGKIKDLPFVKKIVLSGSRARGDNGERADIDIAVDYKGATDYDWLKVRELIEEADTLLKIDCVRFDKLSDEDLLKQNIEKEGKIIYNKGVN